MWFMRIPLDVIHVDKSDRVTHVLRGIKPWRFGPLFVGGKLAIECPSGLPTVHGLATRSSSNRRNRTITPRISASVFSVSSPNSKDLRNGAESWT